MMTDWILKHLIENGSITAEEAKSYYQTCTCAAHIARLKNEGWEIIRIGKNEWKYIGRRESK